MVGTTTMNGMVLSAMPIGEYDRRLTILTVEHGKISAFAKGARKPNSPLLACSQPFSYGGFTVYAGRNSYTITSVQISNYFPKLRKDFEKTCLGMYFCEFADYYAREGNDERGVLKLLYQSLRALESGRFDMRLIRRIFELKLICIEGEAPLVFECVRCRKKEELEIFDFSRDGMLCKECAAKAGLPVSKSNNTESGQEIPFLESVQEGIERVEKPKSILMVSAAALYAMQFIAATPPAKLYQFSLKEEVLQEIEIITERYLHKHIGHEMKSLKVLREIQRVE